MRPRAGSRRAIMDFPVRVSGGRTLAVRDAGDPDGTPVLVQSVRPVPGICTDRTSRMPVCAAYG
jgi:hypothetical protein